MSLPRRKQPSGPNIVLTDHAVQRMGERLLGCKRRDLEAAVRDSVRAGGWAEMFFDAPGVGHLAPVHRYGVGGWVLVNLSAPFGPTAITVFPEDARNINTELFYGHPSPCKALYKRTKYCARRGEQVMTAKYFRGLADLRLACPPDRNPG